MVDVVRGFELVVVVVLVEVLAVEDDGIAEELVVVGVELVTSEVVELVDVIDVVVAFATESDVDGRDVDADVVDVDVSIVEVDAAVAAVLEVAVELVEAVEVTSVVLEDDMF